MHHGKKKRQSLCLLLDCANANPTPPQFSLSILLLSASPLLLLLCRASQQALHPHPIQPTLLNHFLTPHSPSLSMRTTLPFLLPTTTTTTLIPPHKRQQPQRPPGGNPLHPPCHTHAPRPNQAKHTPLLSTQPHNSLIIHIRRQFEMFVALKGASSLRLLEDVRRVGALN